MDTNNINEKLHPESQHITDEELALLHKRAENYLAGKVKAYTIEEADARIRQSRKNKATRTL